MCVDAFRRCASMRCSSRSASPRSAGEGSTASRSGCASVWAWPRLCWATPRCSSSTNLRTGSTPRASIGCVSSCVPTPTAAAPCSVSSHLLAEVAQTVDDVVIIAGGRLVVQSSLVDLAEQARPGVWVRTPQAAALRSALCAEGITSELKSDDTVVAFDTTPERVGIVAAGAGVVIYEMTSQHFDLEEFFLQLTATDGGIQ